MGAAAPPAVLSSVSFGISDVELTGAVPGTAGRPLRPGDGPAVPVLGAGAAGRSAGSVSLRASEVVVFDGRTEVARHARSVPKGSTVLLLDHYLEVLARRPGALPGATALAQTRAAGTFTRAHDAFWARAHKHAGDAGGSRLLVEALLLHRHLAHVDVVAGLVAAVSVGSASPDVVAVEAARPRTPAAPASRGPPHRRSSSTRRRSLRSAGTGW